MTIRCSVVNRCNTTTERVNIVVQILIRESNAIAKKGVKKLKAKILLVMLALMLFVLGCVQDSKPSIDCRRSVTYTVRAGDTLWGIAEKHASLNTYARIYMPVFEESIKEANPKKFQHGRFLQPGDKLQIYYFVKE